MQAALSLPGHFAGSTVGCHRGLNKDNYLLLATSLVAPLPIPVADFIAGLDLVRQGDRRWRARGTPGGHGTTLPILREILRVLLIWLLSGMAAPVSCSFARLARRAPAGSVRLGAVWW